MSLSTFSLTSWLSTVLIHIPTFQSSLAFLGGTHSRVITSTSMTQSSIIAALSTTTLPTLTRRGAVSLHIIAEESIVATTDSCMLSRFVTHTRREAGGSMSTFGLGSNIRTRGGYLTAVQSTSMNSSIGCTANSIVIIETLSSIPAKTSIMTLTSCSTLAMSTRLSTVRRHISAVQPFSIVVTNSLRREVSPFIRILGTQFLVIT
mmetsp:Transcript_6772/g.14916  ORF Transcript_6772/g.14916 Transcript_6772/m.14916 type:complete len:205 (-) Transcript_6772:402-1016(-)